MKNLTHPLQNTPKWISSEIIKRPEGMNKKLKAGDVVYMRTGLEKNTVVNI